jgi:hypothetical protein
VASQRKERASGSSTVRPEALAAQYGQAGCHVAQRDRRVGKAQLLAVDVQGASDLTGGYPQGPPPRSPDGMSFW